MSSVTDENERRRRSLEAGREMLEKYKMDRMTKAKSTDHSQTDEASDEESFHIDKSIDPRESCAHEGISSRDVTHSSISMSEGEADGDLEGLAGRVAKLEELLEGKEAIVEALSAEIDHLRAEASSPNSSQSQNSSIYNKDVISLYHTKFQQFEKAINERDHLIEELTCSLGKALSARDTLVVKLNSLNAMPIFDANTSSAGNNMNLQEKINTLEETLSDQKSMVQKLHGQLAQIQKHAQTLEMEKETRNAEINDYKLQIDNLNEQIRIRAIDKNLNIAETLEQQKQYEARVDKIKQDMQHILEKFTAETNNNIARHQQELKDLAAKHEAEIMNIQEKYEERANQLKEENKILADRLNKELPDLETRHAKELSVFQSQLAYYKKRVENLKLELVSRSESQEAVQAEVNLYKTKLDEFRIQSENSRRVQDLNHQKEKEMLTEQITLHKIQLEDITSKYLSATVVLESKESIERSLEQALTNAATLKEENQTLKFRLDDLSSRYSAAQSLIENSQAHERTLSTRIYDLEKSLSRLSGINVSTLSELNDTTYQTFDEVAIQYQLTRQKLEEKAEMEKLLVEKVQRLEDEVRATKEELEKADLTKKSYDKQLKDMKNTCDKLKSELSVLKETNSRQASVETKLPAQGERDSISGLLQSTENDQQEIKSLKQTLERKEAEIAEYANTLRDMAEKLKKSEEESEQLKNGLATAWAQCAEVEEKLNQTLALSDSRLDASLSTSNYSSALNKQFRFNKPTEDSMNTTQDGTVGTNKSLCERSDQLDDSVMKFLRAKLTSTTAENERLSKELKDLTENRYDYDEIKAKLHHYSALTEKLSTEKERVNEENVALKMKLESVRSFQETLNQLRTEKEALRKEIEALISVHDERMTAVKAETAAEIRKMQSLLLNANEGPSDLRDLRAELEKRHAKEMEELRTYFEEKCLQMEKQYSEEVFSQQSKKMSDNDSEIADLTEGLYFGGGGDCLNVSNMSGPVSRVDSPIEEEHSKHDNRIEEQRKTEIEYEATVKSLRCELERKIIEMEEMKLNFEKMLEDQKDSYERDMQDMREKGRHEYLRNAVNQHCQTEWDAGALENGELSQLRAAYNHQLEEQITLARLDIVNALQEQIQALLMAEPGAEDNWPSELLELRDKFTSNVKREMEQLKETHATEFLRLKEEHSRNIARMIERHQEELSKVKSEISCNHNEKGDSWEVDIVKERNSLNKTCATLKVLVEELIKYFVICEEEVNNTLITEVLKRQLSDALNTGELPVPEEGANDSRTVESQRVDEPSVASNSPEIKIKRVHFAPQSTEIVSIMNSDTNALHAILEGDASITEKLKQDLNNCLHRLKSESAEILGISLTSGGDRLGSLSKEIMWMNKENDELHLKLAHAEALIMSYREEAERLKVNVLELQRKLLYADNKKEIITEGYGEHDDGGNEITMQDFSQLQEKARHVISNGEEDCSYLLQLIEELCRQSDKLMEDARKEKEDLQQQVPLEPTPPPYIHRVCRRKIEAADKQLKGTRRFLDEQASEREAERDEAARQIQLLQEQLKEREREKERDMRITSESSLSSETTSDVPVLQATDISAAVEALECQMREMSSMMSDTEARKLESESELQAAIDKIWVLREIITDFEQQLVARTEKEESLQTQITQLEAVIAAQTKNQHELVQELDAIKMGSECRQLNEHINHLEEEVRKHKLSSEQFNVNSVALKQMKAELRDMQNQLDKRIADLESAHMCGSNLSLSQPSEDVSIREQIDASRCLTPEDPTSPPMLPLDQLLKLKEKMLKHARVEEVAFRRIKDLEMQLTAVRNQNEELQAEQEILQQTASEQLYQIEAMRGRLEQHKQSAPFAQRQATSRLELQLHEANAKFQALERTIADKDMEIKDIRNQLDRVNQLLAEKESEIANVVQVESATIQKLKDHLEVVEEERKMLQAKVGVQEHAQMELPRLIDSMLADKNEEIDHLKEQLSKKEKQLEMYTPLTVDDAYMVDAQLQEMMKQAELKNSARTLSDILSIHSECEEMSEAIRCAPNATQTLPNISTFKFPTPAAHKDTLDGSAIPSTDPNKLAVQIPPLDLGSRSHSLSGMNDQHSLPMDLIQSGFESKTSSSDNNVSTNDTHCEVRLKQTSSNNEETYTDEQNKRKTLDSNDREKSRVTSVKQTQTSINETINEVQSLEYQLQTIREQLQMREVMFNKREADLTALQTVYDELQVAFKETVENLTKDKYFYQNQYELSRVSENKIKKDLEEVENTLKLKTEELNEHRSKMQVNEKIIMEINTENTRLRKDIEEKEAEQGKKYNILLEEKVRELQNLKDAILEKDITIETIQTRNIEIENENKQLYEFKTKYQVSKQQLMECQNEIQRLTESLNNRDQIIRRVEEMASRNSMSGASSPSNEKDQEIHHLQEYLKEKDKVIRQMREDSKSLHRSLQTIQNKMKESGNIVELRKKLKEERKLNTELQETVIKLSRELEELKHLPRRLQDDSDIEDMVQRELNLSAHLDQQILSAIESDPEDGMSIEGQGRVHEQYQQASGDAKSQLIQANKLNEELKKLKDDLEIEVGMLKCQIAEYENRIFQLKSDLTEEAKKVTKLDEELSSERNLVRTLKIQVERDLSAIQSQRIQDSELIGFLKNKLKTSMDNEEKLRNELSERKHESVERQVSLMKEQLELQKAEALPKLTDLLETSRNKYISLTEDLENEKRCNTELRETLKSVQSERNRCEKQLEVAVEEKEKLISSLALVEGVKEHLENDLRRTKEELNAREGECEWLQKRIKTMTDAEAKRQEQRTSEHTELKELRKEINNTRDVMMEFEVEMKQMKRELAESEEREMKLLESLDSFKKKEADLSKKLSAAKEEEKKLQEMIMEMNAPAIFMQKIKDLSDANELHVGEKSILREKLMKMREEKEHLNQRARSLESEIKRVKNVNAKNLDNPEALQYFYGNYLRIDSKRKALTYQKKYLLTIVGGYQLSEENTLCMLSKLTRTERFHITIDHNRKNPKARFRIAVVAVISIHRMRWLLQRWRTKKRIGVQSLLKVKEGQFLMPEQRINMNHSPPVRETSTTKGDNGLDGFTLAQYYERLRNIQQTLGLAMAEPERR